MVAAERLICRSEEVVERGEGVRFTVPALGGSASAFVIRYQQRVYAYLNRCSHVPTELDWQPGQFFDGDGIYLICAVHGALFSPDSGACRYGRCAGRGLHPLQVIERDGAIYFDDSQPALSGIMKA
jgi:nitrite reductase/ring-hydroxylating ferredoxin subunit